MTTSNIVCLFLPPLLERRNCYSSSKHRESVELPQKSIVTGLLFDMTQLSTTTRCPAKEQSFRGPQQAAETYNIPSIVISDKFFTCPINHDLPDGPCLQVFVRQCERLGTATTVSHVKKHLLFLQGGPGFECSSSMPGNSGMLKVLLDRGYIVLLLDQRGTGMSTALCQETLRSQGSLEEQVRYCKHFRADAIVRDCEIIRRKLHITRWTLLGQSFGGFVSLSYLSLYPEALESVLITGGMAPVSYDQPDSVYFRLAKKLIRRNESFYEKYPQDVQRIKRIVGYLDSADLKTPNGGALTSRRFRQIGLDLGMHGGFDRIHNIVQKLTSDLDQAGYFTYKSRETLEHVLHYDGNPIYALLHEAIYCQSQAASDWSAARVLSSYPEFAATVHCHKPCYLFGENIFPWMFDDYAELRPLKELAQRLSQEPWTPLYDLSKLGINTVPIATSCYIMDMYVEIDLAIETLQAVACTKDLVTNRWLHNALRHAPEELLGYLFNLLQDNQP